MGNQKPKSQVQLLREGTLWGDTEKPPKDRCCVCGKKVSEQERVVEQRPTGKGRRLQAWLYCESCAPVKPN
jgi:uncharacterized protein with PIN domain